MKKAYCVFSDFSSEAKDVLIANDIEFTVNPFQTLPNEEELMALLKEYDILILGVRSKLIADMLKFVETPKVIATLSIGVDHIDKAFFTSPLIKIVNIQTANIVSVAEHIFSLLLALNKRLYESNYLVLAGQGEKSAIHERPEDISNKILGVIGAGNITREVIKIAKIFNMKILCYTRHEENHIDLKKYVEFTTLNKLLKESDIINVSIPLTNETRYLISKDSIHLMKPTATFINTSRAEVVDINALIAYADKYDTFYVGLDIDVDNYKDLLSTYRKNVIITPHIAGVSKQALERMDIELANRIIELS
ncbi:MAG: hypothetical protein LBU27_05075 [Candidatus Peribacteria bacterium]|jgi:phosphoglycerate dehydrogenase-like enzyme|nr:hypothetical protein [Candidatus Peribacteria bacterium]